MNFQILSAIPLVAALVAGGCVTPPEELQTASASGSSSSVEAVQLQPVAFDGRLGVGLLACPAMACVGRTVIDSERIFETDGWGALDIDLTMTWDAAGPNTERLVLGVFTCDPAECGSDEDLSQIEYVYGTSPLVFSWVEFQVPAGETLYVFANLAGIVDSGMVWVSATTPQDLHIEGTLAGGA